VKIRKKMPLGVLRCRCENG